MVGVFLLLFYLSNLLKMEFLNNINWRRGQPIHEIERNLILLNHGRGLTNQEIENEINREVKTVKRWLNRFYTTGMFKTLPKSGRPRKNTRTGLYNSIGSNRKSTNN